MRIEIILFDGFDELDAMGPFEVLRNGERFGADIHTELVGAHGATTITAGHGARIVVDRGPSERADLVLVPGGGWFDRDTPGAWVEAQRGDLPALLARTHERGTPVGSVCTGAMLLATAGLVAGRPGTTHHEAIDDLRAAGAEIVDARVVDAGDLITAGGVTSGLDLALWLVEREAGSEIADRVAREVEYERRHAVWRAPAAV
jgi:transcriptional regulator GlxA family with amidase domain